jgi:3-methyladenine DNA glycosylase/8-oxoguanine DNA glycosylase
MRSLSSRKMSAFPQLPRLDPGPAAAARDVLLASAAPTVGTAHTVLLSYYEALFAAYGPQHWWPGRTAFEVIVGAILTQNTSWTNVAPSIESLRRERLLTPRAIERVPRPRLARLIRSSGYFRQKAKKLKAFVRFLRDRYQGSLARMFATPAAALREQLLGVHGIGPETADSILLCSTRWAIRTGKIARCSRTGRDIRSDRFSRRAIWMRLWANLVTIEVGRKPRPQRFA